MKTIILFILIFFSINVSSQCYVYNKVNYCNKKNTSKLDPSLVNSLILKSIGFGLMSLGSHLERQSLDKSISNPANKELYNAGLAIATFSIIFDIKYMTDGTKRNKKKINFHHKNSRKW